MNRDINIKSDMPRILQIAKFAKYEAGDYLVRKLGQAKIKDQKPLRDDLLDVDLEAN